MFDARSSTTDSQHGGKAINEVKKGQVGTIADAGIADRVARAVSADCPASSRARRARRCEGEKSRTATRRRPKGRGCFTGWRKRE